MAAASSGLGLEVGTLPVAVLKAVDPAALQLIVLDEELVLPGVLETLTSVCPRLRVLVIADRVHPELLDTAVRVPQLVGVVARAGGARLALELGYVVRRVSSPQQPAPGAPELLTWGASTVTFRPRTSHDRDRAVEAVESVGHKFGIPRRVASIAAEAAHELLMNAMYGAPIDPTTGAPRYAHDRTASIRLHDAELPTLRLTVDGAYLALDCSDPFGRMTRNKLFRGLVRGLAGELDTAGGGAGLGWHRLFGSASILRVEVVPRRQTIVSWILDRTVDPRAQRAQGRSVYFVDAAA